MIFCLQNNKKLRFMGKTEHAFVEVSWKAED